jgi:Mn-dependent DtxR family transcriptional regulator
MRDTLLRYLRIIPAADAEMMARDLGLSQREVQETLHKMDDDGDVILRHGWYRISEAAKMRLGERSDQK